MNRYTIFTLAVLTMLGLGSAQFPGLDFLNFGASPGEPLSPFRESVRIAPGEVTNVGVIPTEKPVFGIIRGELETHKIGGYAIQSDATVVAVPAGELYREGMGLYSGVFAILSSGTDVTTPSPASTASTARGWPLAVLWITTSTRPSPGTTQ